MFNTGYVVPPAQFAAWIAQQRVRFAPATKTLPPYSKTYRKLIEKAIKA